MESFIGWFKRRGRKSYTLPILMMIAVNCFIFGSGTAKTMFQDPEIPVIIWIMTFIAYFGFHIGLTWHIIMTYKLQRNK